MDRSDRLDALDDQASDASAAEPRRRPSPQPPWVKLVAVAIVVIFLLAAVLSAVL